MLAYTYKHTCIHEYIHIHTYIYMCGSNKCNATYN